MISPAVFAERSTEASLAGFMCLLFAIGLLARFVRWLKEGGFGRKRRKDHSARREQWASREVADEVPAHRLTASRRTSSGAPAPSRRR